MTDLRDAGQTDQLCFVDFIAAEEFDVVTKIAQEPVELPEGFGVAIEAAGNNMVGKATGLENGQSERLIRFLSLSAELDFMHSNQKKSVGDLIGRAPIGGVQACNLTSHAAPSFVPR
jgi:hypothetical protein